MKLCRDEVKGADRIAHGGALWGERSECVKGAVKREEENDSAKGAVKREEENDSAKGAVKREEENDSAKGAVKREEECKCWGCIEEREPVAHRTRRRTSS
jgi:hypothetical protein